MTFARREEILSKDVMGIDEVCDLMGCDKSTASRIVNEIKNALSKKGIEPRIQARGKLHTQDYLDYYRLTR